MIKRILYPTDFSAHAQKCLDYILKLKDCGIEEVVLLHVMDDRIIKYSEEMFEESIDEQTVIDQCQKACATKLAELEKALKNEGLKVKTIVRLGVPFSVIINAAEEVDASMIVMGHRGHTLAKEMLLGSTAEKVARKCRRPLLLIR